MSPDTSHGTAIPSPPRTFRAVAPVIALCWLVVFFDGMDVNIYGAVMPHLLDDKGFGFTASTMRHDRLLDHVRHADRRARLRHTHRLARP